MRNPGARAPTTYPPAPKPLDPPPSPSLGPRGGPKGLLFSVWTQPPFWNCHPAPTPPPTLSCNQGPWFTALSTRPAPVGNPPTPQGILQKHHFPFFVRVRNVKNNDASCEICSVPGARAPTTYPPGTTAPGPPPPEPLYAPPPHRVSQKKSFFFFLHALETSTFQLCRSVAVGIQLQAGSVLDHQTGCGYRRNPQYSGQTLRFVSLYLNILLLQASKILSAKIRRKLRNLLRPWGPCPYHLPPRHRSPWTPPPEPLYPPPPHRASFKKNHFSSFCTRSSKTRCKLRNLLRPWGPCPYHLPPPAPKPLDPPRAPGPRGLLLLWNCHSPYAPPNPLLQPRPLVYRPVHQASSGG